MLINPKCKFLAVLSAESRTLIGPDLFTIVSSQP